MKRKMSNFPYFKETLGDNWKLAYKNFMNTPSKNDMIIANYDDEGFALFNRTNDHGTWEFTGTAK
jgi:hypothetical protein